MIKKWVWAFFMVFCLSSPLFAQDKEKSKWRGWQEYMVGTGGTVGKLWNFGSGTEYSVFRDDTNDEVTISFEFLVDRTAYSSQKLLMPLLANYRWYLGPKHLEGIFITAGLGDAIPFGRDHGSGSIAWAGSIGTQVMEKYTIEFRYIGRRSQQVTNGISTFTTNNSFIGLAGGMRF